MTDLEICPLKPWSVTQAHSSASKDRWTERLQLAAICPGQIKAEV